MSGTGPSFRSAIRWASAAQVGRQVVQFVTIIVLARTLPPSDFGLVTMALVVVGFATVFKDLGVGASLIQRAEMSDLERSSLFWVAAAVGLVATIALLVLAPLISDIYREPDLVPVLRALSISFVIAGVGVVQQAIFERELRYAELARVEIVSSIAAGVVAIALALGGAGVWSLVAQSVIGAIIGTVMLWTISGWRPAMRFDRDRAWSGATFGAGITTFNVTNYVSRNADYFLIGRALGPEQLGYYTLAYRLMLVPLQLVTAATNRVMFPSLSRINHDRDGFAALYLRALGATGFVAFPIAIGLAATSPNLIPVVLGEAWSPAIPVAVILSFVGMLQVIGGSVGPVFLATGAVATLAKWGIASALVVVAAFLVGISWGIVGVSLAYLVASVGLLVPSIRLALAPIGIGPREVVEATWRPLVVAIAMGTVVAILGLLFGDRGSPAAILIVQVISGVAIYGILSLLLNREETRTVVTRLARP